MCTFDTNLPVSPPLQNPCTNTYQYGTDSTAIVDSGANNLYFAQKAPNVNFNPNAPKIYVGTATGAVARSIGTGELNLPFLPAITCQLTSCPSSFLPVSFYNGRSGSLIYHWLLSIKMKSCAMKSPITTSNLPWSIDILTITLWAKMSMETRYLQDNMHGV